MRARAEQLAPADEALGVQFEDISLKVISAQECSQRRQHTSQWRHSNRRRQCKLIATRRRAIKTKNAGADHIRFARFDSNIIREGIPRPISTRRSPRPAHSSSARRGDSSRPGGVARPCEPALGRRADVRGAIACRRLAAGASSARQSAGNKTNSSGGATQSGHRCALVGLRRVERAVRLGPYGSGRRRRDLRDAVYEAPPALTMRL